MLIQVCFIAAVAYLGVKVKRILSVLDVKLERIFNVADSIDHTASDILLAQKREGLEELIRSGAEVEIGNLGIDELTRTLPTE